MTTPKTLPPAAFERLDDLHFRASALTRGPWHPEHQHAGPPIALLCRVVEQVAAADGLTHVARLTANLLRPVPIGELRATLARDYVGRNAGHYGASLFAQDKEVLRMTVLMQREVDLELPATAIAAPATPQPRPPAEGEAVLPPFAGAHVGYSDLVENRIVQGRFFAGPCQAWVRMARPLLAGEPTSPYAAVAVAADSGNGVSAMLDFRAWTFVNSDLTINFLRRPQGEWVCLDARTHWGDHGGGLAESALWDEQGLIGRGTQSLLLRPRG